MTDIKPLQGLDPSRFETTAILKRLAAANRSLAELKGVAASIPNQGLLIDTLGLQEAKESSAVESIVTTDDQLFRGELFPDQPGDPVAKEVLRYRQALRVGFDAVVARGMLTINDILTIRAELEQETSGFRKLPGTVLRDQNGRVIFTPPQGHDAIVTAMSDLEEFINRPELFGADPLIKMVLIHHQFESIHPFYDGNGRTGRIINVLYLVLQRLLDIPVLYLSRHIVRTKADYYRLLQAVRDEDAWEPWVIYMLEAVESTARDGITTVEAIRILLLRIKHLIREKHAFYSQDLINSLFAHPYTTVEFLQRDLKISRATAIKYLNRLTADGILMKVRIGRPNFYVNHALVAVLAPGLAVEMTPQNAT